MTHLDLGKFEPVQFSRTAQRGCLAAAFDLGRVCAFSHWWSTAFRLAELGRYQLEISEDEILDTVQINFHEHAETVFDTNSAREQFEEIVLDAWGTISQSLFEDYGDHFESDPASLVFWHEVQEQHRIDKALKSVIAPKMRLSLKLGFHFDTALRRLDSNFRPSSPWEFLFARFRELRIADSDLDFSLAWIRKRNNFLFRIGVDRRLVMDLRFESTGAQLYREMYAAIVRCLYQAETESDQTKLKPGYLGLILDKDDREIRRAGVEWDNIKVELGNAGDLKLIFRELLATKETPITGRELAERIDPEKYTSLRQQIRNLRERLLPLGITVSEQKYRLEPLELS